MGIISWKYFEEQVLKLGVGIGLGGGGRVLGMGVVGTVSRVRRVREIGKWCHWVEESSICRSITMGIEIG
jgi:hypothetical protein